MIHPRLIATHLRAYCARPAEREAACRNLVFAAVRLAMHHLGAKAVAWVVLQALEDRKDRAA